MAEALTVEIVSPERVLFSGEADMVITRTLGGGEIAFQAGHAPFLAALTHNRTRIYLTDGTVVDAAIFGGFVEVSGSPTKVSILSDGSELAHEIDLAQAQAELAELNEALDRHRHLLAEEQRESTLADILSAKSRAETRIATVGGGFTA